MVHIKRFSFNPFQVNTYVISDETRECVIIDPGMQGKDEENELFDYIASNQLKPVLLLNTHAHIDHIVGNAVVAKTYELPLGAHSDCEPFLIHSKEYARTFGLQLDEVQAIGFYITPEETLSFGNSSISVLHTPGHANGSVCFYCEEAKFVVTGDVLFYQSIGRTDLKTGNYDLLQQSIWEKLFTLPDDTIAYPGHGPETSIGSEKVNNPFVAIGRSDA